MKPLCFILMPFGIKKDRNGRDINFNKVYSEIIKPAVDQCDIQPIRADEELLGGNIHKPMFERIVLCEYAIADLTSLNPNVFYELGVRHAIKPYTTIPISAFDAPLPFDVHSERTIDYSLDENGVPNNAEADIQKLIVKLEYCRLNKATDSPIFQLIDGWKVSHNLSHEKTDVFRDQAAYEHDTLDRLAAARANGPDAVKSIFEELKPVAEKPVGVVMDLFLSLRAVECWDDMIICYEQLDAPLQNLKLFREQAGFAYNRKGDKQNAKRILEQIIEDFGDDPETNGILGRVYKDLFKEYKAAGNKLKSQANLNKAIQVYKDGFNADWRDAYPGINLVTLLDIKGNREQVMQYVPIVRFALERKLESKHVDYWDKATLAELEVLGGDYDTAKEQLIDAIGLIPDGEEWMLKTTLNNLSLISDSRKENGQDDPRLTDLVKEMELML